MNQQITATQDGDETYLILKGQEAANTSASSTVQTSGNNKCDTHLHQHSGS